MRDSYRPRYNDAAAGSDHWNEYMETMPREELDDLHLRRIRRNVEYAYENIPFYREIYDDAGVEPSDIRTLEDFNTKVPIIDKPQLMEIQREHGGDPFRGRDPAGAEHHIYRFQTSGTTGTPLQEAVTQPATMAVGDAWNYGFWRCGVRPDDTFYFAFPFGTFLGFWSAYWGVRRLGATVRSGAGQSTEERIDDIVSVDPDVVVMTPTYAMYLLEKADEMGVDLSDTSVRLTVHAGEKGPFVDSVRSRIEDGWGAEVWDAYGQSESIFLGTTMDVNAGGVNPVEPYYYSTIVDPDTDEVIHEDGARGEHIITCHIPTAPGLTLRYRSHDIVEMYHDSRDVFDTDLTWKFFEGSVLDRTDNMLTLRGTNIYPRAVEEIMTGVEHATPHYEIHVDRVSGNDQMTVKMEADPDLDRDAYDDLAHDLQAELREAVGVRIDFEILEPRSLPRYELKSRRFFDHRDES
ncbi:phenylacetate--CoA ligase family protein [Halobaculum sp. EA56]|uniref:phenylacetate--CoA ligase family protein n=1 Tax=Halobaculum sp. EA56 TaxID=3421648 RepID=UPI003EBC668D